ncbi:DUF1156 domain-containing protein [Arthrobacter sp. Y-9]|uniref:DUF1156 domain-containing protein n=1 Tax=Arthrobacter sp. Y-9 TaxID=3039385 RepID=UPI00241E4741|nr:DUF1156 domain-containing protein [Arthrobacter sp. Y-9]WFR83892.1 DUF1156 domain-containing protein [Arthrobacter sp. Y-9]
MKKKLIEVALPLEAINAQSAREKSIRHGHPSTLHLWWARRPLATARAVLFAQLVDDPSERAEEFRSEALQKGESDVEAYVEQRVDGERERLFGLITRMVDWDNLNDEALFEQVRAEIMRSTDGNPPAILDPFAGGGTIPLEAQRLGLEAHASDLNPVAVLINKALIEIPPKFANQAPVYPKAADQRHWWPKATGLAEDVRRYGSWMRDEAERRIGHLYPKATLSDGSEATVIAWIWARTVTCPNPACGIEMPLVRSWWLGKKKGKEAYIVPTVVDGKVEYSVGHDVQSAPTKEADGTMSGRRGATCVSCGAAVPVEFIKSEGLAGRLGATLMATVAEGNRQRIYLAPTAEHRAAAEVGTPSDIPMQKLGIDPRNIWTPSYGLDSFASLFTNRQLTALTTFSDLVGEARERALQDALAADMPEGEPLELGGAGAAAYADAIASYLGLCASKMAMFHCTLARWRSDADKTAPAFGRQAIAMVWDYAEAQPFVRAGGEWLGVVEGAARTLEKLVALPVAHAQQDSAASLTVGNRLISTDPPYYDNISYADLSDYFYVWLRKSLKREYPDLLSTMLVPKAEELIANPYRQGGDRQAQDYFKSGFESVFATARKSAVDAYPITVYYAFKQTEEDADGVSSTGWETVLSAMISAGWSVTATWPMRTENATRLIGRGSNALASSVVLALRPRPEDAPVIDRRGLLAELRATLPEALRNLQKGGIAPVDMAQAAIGPGMAVFSQYSRVIEPSGDPMSVRDALRAINAILDEVLSQQEGDFDDDTRWCVTWFETHGFDVAAYGEAETLASAKNSSVAGLAQSGVISSGAGKVKLLSQEELPGGYDPRADDRISLWEVVLHMARALENEGLDAAGRILDGADERGLDMTAANELAYLLYSIAEKRGLTKAGIAFNTLGSSWADVKAAAAALDKADATWATPTLDFDGLGE